MRSASSTPAHEYAARSGTRTSLGQRRAGAGLQWIEVPASDTRDREDRGIRRSLDLLVLPSLLLAGGPFIVLLATGAIGESGFVTPALGLLPLVTPLALRAAGRRWDPLLLAPVWVLCALGMMVIARVQPDLVPVQTLWIALGWGLFVLGMGFPHLMRLLSGLSWLWLSMALLLAASTLLLGEDVTGQGARLWLQVGPVAIQPAEVLRVALVVFLAAALSRSTVPPEADATDRPLEDGPPPPPSSGAGYSTDYVAALAALGASALVVIAQGDFGPALTFAGTFLAMSYLAVGHLRRHVALVGVFVLLGAGAVLASSRLETRLVTWVDPWSDAQGTGYQSLQALGGFVFGGVTGSGPGYGHPGLIPAAHTDYPLAVLGEEWGLFGTLAVVVLYALLVTRGLHRARTSGSRFGQMLGIGLSVSLGLQVLVVLGGVLRLLPLTGITSPFLSYGGSSMLMSWVMLAILLRTSTAARGVSATMPMALTTAVPGPRLGHVGGALLAGFGALTLALGYWQVARADLAADPAVSGARLTLEAERITRGRLLDREGRVLAETVEGPDGTPQRVYHAPGAAHLLGFDSPVLGAAGVEARASDALMGRNQLTPLDTLRDLLHRPRSGADVQLTLDLDVQRAAEEAMGGDIGAVVALDARTGDVLAMVSNPGFAADDLGEEGWRLLREDPASPLLNRATQGRYTPGSTFKTVTLIAALEAGLVTPSTAAACPVETFIEGTRITSRNEPPGRRTQTVEDAFAYSCNTYFAELGVELGRDALVATAEALGLTGEPPFELDTVRGQLAGTEGFLESDAGLAATAFGQGELQLSPLHLALVVAGVANDGVVPRPRVLATTEVEAWRRAMSPETARAVASMMVTGVERGWAAPAAIAGTEVGGKTGSAEFSDDASSHAVFIAFASAGDARIAVAVVKEAAGAGSIEAAPVARQVMQAWLAQPSVAR